MKERQLIINNIPTNVIELQGEGRLVVFIHGWGTQAESLRTLAMRVSHRHCCRAILLDLPGFGKSTPPPEPWGVEQYAQHVHNLLEKLGVATPYALVGHSLGGRIIIKGSAIGALKADKLILIAAAGAAPRYTLRLFFFKIIAKIGKVLCAVPPFSFVAESLRRWLYRSAGSDDYLQSRSMKRTFSLVVNENLTRYAKQITTPTLLLWGENDTTTPLREGETLHKLIDGSRLVTIPRAGHYVYRDAEPRIIEHITDFLD